MLDANNSDCFERSVGVASSCGLDPVVVRCRAPSQLIFDEFLEGRPLPVGAAEPGPGLPVSRVLASCEEWFEWACGSVGLAVRRAQQCESVCKVVDGAVRAAYGSGCEAPQNCKTQALLPYTCSKEVEYLLWNSCDFAGEAIPLAVEERIGDFTRPYPEEAGLCYGADAVVEGADLVNDGTPPLNVGTYVQEHEMCHDGNACRFACVNQGWSVQRTHDRLAVAFNYVGPCACPELTSQTVVYNTVGPPGDVTSPVAARLSGTHADQPFSAMLFPISSSNQVSFRARDWRVHVMRNTDNAFGETQPGAGADEVRARPVRVCVHAGQRRVPRAPRRELAGFVAGGCGGLCGIQRARVGRGLPSRGCEPHCALPRAGATQGDEKSCWSEADGRRWRERRERTAGEQAI
eukprot:1547601-Rhodomonas_salina.1